jgi:hypothetical protein
MERRTKITIGEIVLILIIAAEVVIFLGYTKPGNFVLNGLGLTAVWGSSSDCWIRGVDRMVIRKPLAIPPALAKPFIKDMAAYFIEPDAIKRNEIAARQLHTFGSTGAAGEGTASV